MASESGEPPAKLPREGEDIVSVKQLIKASSPRIQIVDEPAVGGGRKRKSQVWDEFQRVLLDDEATNFVACKRCDHVLKNVPGHEGTGTSSMQRHAESHKKVVAGQKTMTSFFGKAGHEGQKNAMKKKLARSIAVFSAIDMRPLGVSDGAGFKAQAQAFVQVGATLGAVDLEKDGLIPGRTAVTRAVETIYDEVKDAVKKELANQPVVTFTTDHWTDKVTGSEYQSATAFYVGDDFQLKSRVLKIDTAEEAHTAANISAKMDAIIQDYEFGGRSRFVTDNAASMKAAFRQKDWAGCTCHQLNLVVQATLQVNEEELPLKSISEATKTVVRYMRKSKTNKKLARRLRQSVVTRWNSELVMLKSVLESYHDFQLLEECPEVARFLSAVSEQNLGDLVKTLDFFQTATDTLESEGATAFMVPVVREKAERELAPVATDRPFTARLKEHLLSGMRRKFVVTDGHLLAAMLHPRYRSLRQFSFLDERRRASIRELLVAELVKDAQSQGDQTTDAAVSSGSDPQSSSLEMETGAELELEDLDDLPTPTVAPTKELAMAAVERYMTTPPTAPVKKVLDFWRTAGQQHPELQRVARCAHGLPASSASSERLFSVAGRTVEPRRSALSPEHLDQLLLIKGNQDLLK